MKATLQKGSHLPPREGRNAGQKETGEKKDDGREHGGPYHRHAEIIGQSRLAHLPKEHGWDGDIVHELVRRPHEPLLHESERPKGDAHEDDHEYGNYGDKDISHEASLTGPALSGKQDPVRRGGHRALLQRRGQTVRGGPSVPPSLCHSRNPIPGRRVFSFTTRR